MNHQVSRNSRLKLCSPSQTIQYLNASQIVAVPTETVYGLAAALNQPSALQALIQLKNRTVHSGKVFTLVPSTLAEITRYAVVSTTVQPHLTRYLPGAVTFILPKNPQFHHPYYDHFSTIGIRIPDYPLFQTILPQTGPLILTSANHRAQPVARTPAEIRHFLPEVQYLATGAVGQQAASTIVDFTTPTPKILRQGGLIIPL